jgi:hypothetical protein
MYFNFLSTIAVVVITYYTSLIRLATTAELMVNYQRLFYTLNCTDGITLPQYGIYKKQNTVKKLNNSISSAHNILPENAFNSSNDHENCGIN